MNEQNQQALDWLEHLSSEYRRVALDSNRMLHLDDEHARGFRVADDALEQHLDDLKGRVRRKALENE